MKKIAIVLLTFSVLISCKNETEKTSEENNYDKLNELEWVIGDWININEASQSFEFWEKINDSTFIASSTTLRGKDTVFAERMKLYQENNVVKLMVETVGPEPNPVVFAQKEDAEHAFTFENPRNEFPSQIVYTNPEPEQIRAWVAGFIDSVPQRQEFYYVRAE